MNAASIWIVFMLKRQSGALLRMDTNRSSRHFKTKRCIVGMSATTRASRHYRRRWRGIAVAPTTTVLGCWLWWRRAKPSLRLPRDGKPPRNSSTTQASNTGSPMRIAWRSNSLRHSPPSTGPSHWTTKIPGTDVSVLTYCWGLSGTRKRSRTRKPYLDKEPNHWHSFEQMINAGSRHGSSRGRGSLCEGVGTACTCRARSIARRVKIPQYPTIVLDQALELVDKALDINADDWYAHHLRGLVLFDMADYTRASEELRQVASHQPNSVSCARSAVRRVAHFRANGRKPLDVAERLIEIDPDHSHAHYVRGEALIGLDRPADAVAAFNELLSTSDYRSLLFASASVPRDRRLRVRRKVPRPGRRTAARQSRISGSNARVFTSTKVRVPRGDGDVHRQTRTPARQFAMLGRLLAAQAVCCRPSRLPVAFGTIGAGLVRQTIRARREEQHLQAIVENPELSLYATSVPGIFPTVWPKLQCSVEGAARRGSRRPHTDRLPEGERR